MAQNKSRRLLWAVCLAALAAFAAAMVWLHYQQLCSPGGGSDPYTSDLGMHLAFAQRGMVYSTVSLLIGPAYALAGRIGIAVLLAAFHLAAVAVFACGLRTALPDAPRPARLLLSLVVNLATAVWMPRGGYWYQALSAARFITTQRILCSRPSHCWRCWPFTVSGRRCAMTWICVPTRSTRCC